MCLCFNKTLTNPLCLPKNKLYLINLRNPLPLTMIPNLNPFRYNLISNSKFPTFNKNSMKAPSCTITLAPIFRVSFKIISFLLETSFLTTKKEFYTINSTNNSFYNKTTIVSKLSNTSNNSNKCSNFCNNSMTKMAINFCLINSPLTNNLCLTLIIQILFFSNSKLSILNK